MGPNAALGAGFILLACFTAQSEQIMGLLGWGRKQVESSDGINGAVLDSDPLKMRIGAGQGIDAQVTSDNAVSEEMSAVSLLDEQRRRELSRVELNGDEIQADGDNVALSDALPSLNQYVVTPMEDFLVEGGFAGVEERNNQGGEGSFNGLPVERTLEYFPPPVKELS